MEDSRDPCFQDQSMLIEAAYLLIRAYMKIEKAELE